jgi:S1-C subfamily serine protease
MSKLALLLLASLAWGTPAHAQVDPRRTPIVQAVERATPAVVTIQVEVQAASPFLRFQAQQQASEGSGVIIGADGVVLTNAHVVDAARRISVVLQDGRTFEAGVVAADAALDLAVLQLQGASDLPTIAIGDSGDLLLGEPAIAIGNPYGLGLTVSTGVVSSIARDMNVGQGPVQTYIQTDAAINPGNSGGALVNIYGELIGINTFIHSAAEGVGFAIPVNRARKIATDLMAHGSVQVPWLGVGLQDVITRRRRPAVVVRQVYAGSPAERAGVRAGDLFTTLDGHEVTTRADLNARLAELNAGTTVSLGYRREGAAGTVRVVAGPPSTGLGAAALTSRWGVSARSVGGEAVEITAADPKGVWATTGLQVGDIVYEVDGRRTRTTQELQEALGRAIARHRPSVLVLVVRRPYRGHVEVTL